MEDYKYMIKVIHVIISLTGLNAVYRHGLNAKSITINWIKNRLLSFSNCTKTYVNSTYFKILCIHF